MADEDRPAHGSALGHTIGLGGNGLLWGIGTYGWGVAALIAGGIGAIGLAAAMRRRRAGRKGGGGSGGGGGSRGGGLRGMLGGMRRSRHTHTSSSGGGGGKGKGLLGRSRRPGTGHTPSGGAGTGSRKGLLGRIAGRSTNPKRGGGIPGRGSTANRHKNPLSKGGAPKSRTPGAKRPSHTPSKSSTPGQRRRSKGLLPALTGRRRNKDQTGTGRNRDKDRAKNKSRERQGRLRRLLGKSITPASLLGWLKPKTKRQKKDQPSGWEKAPTWNKETIMTEATPKPPAPARRTTRKPPSPRAAAAAGVAAGGGGQFTSGAEQFAAALSKPAIPVDTVKGMDKALTDLHTAMKVVANGIQNFGKVSEDALPDEAALHEQLAQNALQMTQMAEGIELTLSDQRRRLAADYQRIDEGRKNEKGYDWQSNQE